MTERCEPNPTACNCENLCCPRCRRRLELGRELEERPACPIPEPGEEPACDVCDDNIAPDGFPYEDYESEEHLL